MLRHYCAAGVITIVNVFVAIYCTRKNAHTRELLSAARDAQRELARYHRAKELGHPIRPNEYPHIFPPALEAKLQNPLVANVPRKRS